MVGLLEVCYLVGLLGDGGGGDGALGFQYAPVVLAEGLDGGSHVVLVLWLGQGGLAGGGHQELLRGAIGGFNAGALVGLPGASV